MKVLRLNEVMGRTGQSRTSIWRLERRGDFPRKVQLAPGAIGYREDEVDEWIERRSAERKPVPRIHGLRPPPMSSRLSSQRLEDLRAWVEARLRESTCDPGSK
jgi:prophage regulatory protein